MNAPHYILVGSLIDGASTAVHRNIYLAIADGRITAIGPLSALSPASGAKITDLSGFVILPALVDCSVALTRSPALSRQDLQATDMNELTIAGTLLATHAGYYRDSGVLAVADHSDSSALLTGYEETTPARRKIAICCTTGPDRRTAPGMNHFLRVRYTADIDGDQAPPSVIAPAELEELCSTRAGKKTVVVANGSDRVREALAGGCDAIEQGYGMGEENLLRMADNGVLWIPSLLRAKNRLDSSGSGGTVCCRFSQRHGAPGTPLPGAEEFWQQVLADHLALVRRAREIGVNVAVGTGAGHPGILHGESVAEEIKLFTKAGYPIAEAIRNGSTNGAEFFGFPQPAPLSVGNPATFLATRGSVSQMLRKLNFLERIYIEGRSSACNTDDAIQARVPL